MHSETLRGERKKFLQSGFCCVVERSISDAVLLPSPTLPPLFRRGGGREFALMGEAIEVDD
jgi:hypothetical protein